MIVPAIGMPGPFELSLIVLVVLILFGVGRLPQVFESLGKGVKSFRDAQKDVVGGEPSPRLEAEDVEEVQPAKDDAKS